MKNMTMIQNMTHKINRRLLSLLILLIVSAQAIWAQTISKDDITETLNIAERTVTYTLPAVQISEGCTITWNVDDKTVTTGLSDDGQTITLPLSNKVRKAKVTISSQDAESQTLSFDINPKTYGEDYNGQHFYADSFHAYEDGTQGDGSKEKPFLISNDLELALLARNVTNANVEQMYSGKYFKLSDDINLSSAIWMPIGTWSTKTKHFFAGKFDGDGHTVSDMRINWTNEANDEASWGLFSRLYGKSSSESGYATVTNLVILNASVEKKAGFQPQAGTSKIGVIAGDLTDNAEVSNIIIRESKMTDNGEQYKVPGKCRIGGIIGYLASARFKIYNISANTEINILKNATVNNDVTLAGGIGCIGRFTTNNAILPTNIYVHGPAIVTSSSTRVRKAGVIAIYNDGYAMSADQQKTLYYSPEMKQTEGTVYNYGSEKEISAFGQTFATQCNDFISSKKFDKKMWSYFSSTNRFSFSSLMLKVERGNSDVLKVVNQAGETSAEKYDWYVSYDNINWTKLNTEPCSTQTLPRKDYSQYVYAILPDGTQRTSIDIVKGILMSAVIDTKTKPGTFIVSVSNNTKISNKALGLTINYEWYQGTTKLAGENDSTYTRPSSASDTDQYSCHVTVYSGTLLLLDKWFSTTTVVYLKPTDTQSTSESDRMASEDWGYTPEKPMLTWKGAYSKLSTHASWSENYIVLMGTSSASVTNNTETGFAITPNYTKDANLNYADWDNVRTTSPLCSNATITGKWEDKDYNGTIEILGSSNGLPIWGDTRFQYLTFINNTTGGSNYYKVIYCQYHNLEMGEGIQMKNFKQVMPGYGTIDGAVTNAFHIFGGFNNDGRFYPLNTKENIEKFEASMPHGREGFKIKVKSGFYSCICAGGRQTSLIERQNGVMGTPNMPIKCTIDIDIDRKWNDEHNETRTLTDAYNGQTRNNDYDIGIILAGNHEGAMYADVDIDIKSGKVARVVNGILGATRNLKLSYTENGITKEYHVPDNTFMGRANIMLDPASSENNKDEDVNGRIVVTELYGGSTGRGQGEKVKVNNPFYGYSTITINGGTFKILPEDNKKKDVILSGIYGAGAGGMNGIGYGADNADTHTPDESIPYWNNAKTVMLYGPYADAKDRLIKYHCYNTEDNTYTDVDPTETNTQIVINGGVFGSSSENIDGIYAGGSGYMSKGLWTYKGIPNKCGGNVYGKPGETVASLTINGGEFYCKNGVFAGGRGTDYYYATDKYSGDAAEYTDLGKTYGNVELNISGGIFHCSVYGGGYGVADAKSIDTGDISTLSNMARVYGQSTVQIHGGTFYQNIYGGGDMAVTEYHGGDPTTNVTVSDSADIRGSVFAGGNGRPLRIGDYSKNDGQTLLPDSVGKVIGSTSIFFSGTTALAPYIYGNIYGGGNLANVTGDTHVNLYAGHFAGQIFGGGNGLLNDDHTVRNSADVLGNTLVMLAQDQGNQKEDENGKKVDNFSINVIWDKLWDGEKFISWDEDKTQFFNNGKFLNPHNIYGGGNLACKVGTYTKAEGKALATAAEGTGLATVEVLKGMTPFSLLQTEDWKTSYTDNKNPHFSVFGGGYGANTLVGSTNVTVDVEGDYGVYNAEAGDNDEQLARPNTNKSNKRKARKTKSNTEEQSDNNTLPVFDNSKGIPNFTVHSVMGGGYAGIVKGNTKVTVDGQTFIHRVYGGGFGDPNATSEADITGQVDGNAEVYVKGAKIYGDIFGGGAGVSPSENIYFTEVARVLGNTKVEVSDDAKVYGKVYGGGDIANVGPVDANYTPDYTQQPTSETAIDQKSGNPTTNYKYTSDHYRTLVNIMGGDIYGEVYGGGKGIKKIQTTNGITTTYARYNELGRINGNTLVHVANTFNDSYSTESFDQAGNNIPYIWNRIYGGCAYGTVNGNTLVHIEGGMLGLNIFGGGYGDVPVIDEESKDYVESSDLSALEQVLGKKYDDSVVTYANILGNTKVKIDGGSYIWNKKADTDGNIMTWLATQSSSEKTCNSLNEYKLMVRDIKNAKTLSDITNPQVKAAINRIQNDGSTKAFFTLSEGNVLAGSFVKNHNIFGGGNRACNVGTYADETTNDVTTAPATGTGDAIVEINHSPVDVLTDDHQQKVSLFDYNTLQGLCWYIASRNTTHPQFSVFGAGYGANTKVGNTKVYARPGAMIKSNGNLYTIDGKQYRYICQEKDRETYTNFQQGLFNDFRKVSSDDLKRYYGSSDGTSSDPNTFRRYHISRMAWMLGLPGFTFIDIHGGGFSGYVVGDTYVEADNQLACNNLYGAGLGAQPYFGENETYKEKGKYDFGSIGGSAKVFIKSGTISQSVYGGGAGIESAYINKGKINGSNDKTGTLVDFPDMARVNKKTEVHIYGETIDEGQLRLDRTLLIGKVFGGGDVANVGTTEAKADSIGKTAYYDNPNDFTSLVDVRGGTLLSHFFAGGNGRTEEACKDYKKVGGIYGNTAIVIDKPAMSYPYLKQKDGSTDEYTMTSLDPSDNAYLKHPENADNITVGPQLFDHVYGGCQNGTVYGNTYVGINGGTLYHNVFGGGWGNISTSNAKGVTTQLITSADVTGNTHLYITGGKIGLTAYWLDDTRFWEPSTIIGGVTYSPQYDPTTQKFKINHNFYGGGNVACQIGTTGADGKLNGGSGNARIHMEKGLLYKDTQVLSDGKTEDFFASNEWKEVYNKVGSPHFCVFGGGYGDSTIVKGDTWLKIEMSERPSQIDSTLDIKEGEEYKHFYSGYSVMDIVGGGYSGKVEGDTHIFGSGGGFCRRVFGGGFYNSVQNTHIDLKAIDCQDVFGGGLMGDVKLSTNITIGQNGKTTSQQDADSEGSSTSSGFTNADIFIHGNIYGGNDVSGYVNINDDNGFFADNGGDGTNIHVYGGHIYGDVYGAGNGDYLYALDRKGNTKVTVNEDYPLNPNDPNSETVPLVYTVPMRDRMPSVWAASDAAKIVNINSWRPLTNRTEIHIEGTSNTDRAQIDGAVYGGGNSATVQKVQAHGTSTQSVELSGSVDINIGSHVKIGSVFMGCNGDALFTATEDNNFMGKFQRLNGSVYDATKELNFADTIDWTGDPSNKSIDELYLPTKAKDRPSVYPHLIDLYFQPVEMNFQGMIWWGKGLSDCTIGSFYCGGNRGNMNVYPDDNNNAVNYTFPTGLTITDKIVGGCNKANYEYIGTDKKVTHEGGYLLGLTGTGSANTTPSQVDDFDGDGTQNVGTRNIKPYIQLNIKNRFKPQEKDGAYQGGNVYGGCYETGTIKGNVSLIMQSDMLKDKDTTKLEMSNEKLGKDPAYSALNVYGAGFGMESYVYGNTHIVMGNDSIKDVSANFVYGGGQQGNVIGVTNVDIKNGHIFRSVTGGSYSGYVWGSTQVIVGYPKYYQSTTSGKCRLYLKRTDEKHKSLKDYDNSPTIKQMIYLTPGDIVSQAVYDDAIAADNGNENTKEVFKDEIDKQSYFDVVSTDTSSVNWDNVDIKIGEAVYGGGYSLAQGSSVLANNTTVLKYTDQYNLDNGDLENSTVGYGGNTTILVGDNTAKGQTKDHITISQQDKENDNDGGIFGDGHLSYAQGFRSADVTGYGFSEKTIDNPKYINTFQRLDILRLEDNCFTLNGARDYASNYDSNTTNKSNMTPYSISRVGEIKMVATNVATENDGSLKTATYCKRARNYMGLANNIHYVGAVESNVTFDDTWHDDSGKESSDANLSNKTYKQVKKWYIDQYYDKDNTEFNKRNNGTAKNMIGIASGYALKIQNIQTIRKDGTVKDSLYYGPIKGVIEMNLINVHPNEGGGYVYADNEHSVSTTGNTDGGTTQETETESFLETSGNFVFPYAKNNNAQYIVDDCFPNGYKSKEGKWKEVPAHYWYVTGLNYYYNVHLTGYTYDSSGANAEIKFDSDNNDGLTVLSGLQAKQNVSIQSWKMDSGHPEDKKEYSSDLEYRNYLIKDTDKNKEGYDEKAIGGYLLYVGASNSTTFEGATSTDDEQKTTRGFSALLPMNATESSNYDTNNIFNSTLPDKLSEDAKITFQLVDKVNNTTSEYFQKHLSKKSKGILVLTAPALDESGNPRKDKDGNEQDYTYTINLTIEYVQGPSISGEITIDNCALPGEMIRLKKDKVTIDADQSFSATGYYWHIGKLKTDENGNKVFEDGTAWADKPNASNNNTYKIGDKTEKERTDLFAGSNYDKTKDYLDIPAYYFMNGYGVQLGVTMSGYGDQIFLLGMKAKDQLTIHNYHEMDPHKEGIDLHIPDAIKRAKEDKNFAEPRIYLFDQTDLKAFGTFITTDSIDGGAHAQFILQNDLSVPTGYTGGEATFKGTFHGNGQVISGLDPSKSLFAENQGNIYNLGLASGKIAEKGCTASTSTGADANTQMGVYHCSYEYEPGENAAPIVYGMDGNRLYRNGSTTDATQTPYTLDDFKYGRVAYDLNQYYLTARGYMKEQGKKLNELTLTSDQKAAIDYIYKYVENGDYQYARRTDKITGKNTGVTFLRTGSDSNLPNYGYAETRHDKKHTIDAPRAVYQKDANGNEMEDSDGNKILDHYEPLLGYEQDDMNDFLFWGQSLQTQPDIYPSCIASHQVKYMTNRVYRTVGYYGSTQKDQFHYNAYNFGNSYMGTYVHLPATTAIDFTADDDNASIFYNFTVKDGVTQNLLVYTPSKIQTIADADAQNSIGTEAYDVVKKTLSYDENTPESSIKGHHIVKVNTTSSSNESSAGESSAASTAASYSTQLLHLVERTPEGKNSEGEDCKNNDFCVPIQFEVSDHAWYVRKPMFYAEDATGAWEGICLPFTAKKVEASLNGEITHFYGAEASDANGINTTTQHHEYWLRGLTTIGTEKDGKTTATFMRPGDSSASGTDAASALFTQGNSEKMDYTFYNSFFADTYGSKQYNKVDNPYYIQTQEYKDYLPLAANVPYVVRFPGYRYYEFDLSSQFYNNITGKSAEAQTITFNAYGEKSSDNGDNSESSKSQNSAIVIPITGAMSTVANGYAHQGTFAAKAVANGVYGMNATGTAFDDASTLQIVMPFRTYMGKTTTASSARANSLTRATSESRTASTPSIIYISEGRSIEKINPEVKSDKNETGDYLTVRPLGQRRVRIESTYATQLQVYTLSGQLFRVLDVQPGTATYSGFAPAIYIFGETKVIVK